MSDERWSNCWAWAVPEYIRRLRAWMGAGMPSDDQPRIVVLPSISRPRWVPHCQVHGFGPAQEFVPVVRRDLPGWLVWTRILFLGHVREVASCQKL